MGLNVSFGIDLGLFSDEFSLLGEGSGGLGPFNDAVCSTCAPPQTKPEIRVAFAPSDLVFDARATPCPECVFAGSLLFQAPPTLLGPDGNTNPFTMSGTLTAFRPASDAPVFATRVFGGGHLITGQQDLVFRFSDVTPTPEPSTLIFFGSGLLGLLAWRRWTRRSGAPPDWTRAGA